MRVATHVSAQRQTTIAAGSEDRPPHGPPLVWCPAPGLACVSMSSSVRARRLLYRLAAALQQVIRPLVPIDWGGVKCVLTDDDQVLLVRHTYGSRLWDLPGGGRRRGERPVDAARREMGEELGREIDNWRPLGRLHARIERHRQTIDVYGAELSSPTLRLDLGELEVAAWFERDGLPLDTATLVRPILAGAGLTSPA